MRILEAAKRQRFLIADSSVYRITEWRRLVQLESGILVLARMFRFYGRLWERIVLRVAVNSGESRCDGCSSRMTVKRVAFGRNKHNWGRLPAGISRDKIWGSRAKQSVC